MRVKAVSKMECLFLEPITFGEAESTDTGAMGFWTDGRNFGEIVFQNPLPRLKSTKKGVGENTRAFCFGSMELIPTASYNGPCLQLG